MQCSARSASPATHSNEPARQCLQVFAEGTPCGADNDRPEKDHLHDRDEGIGIPLKDQPRLFDFFFRAGNVGGIPGTGLGLLVVQALRRCTWREHRVHLVPGEGTRFTVTLPTDLPPFMKTSKSKNSRSGRQ